MTTHTPHAKDLITLAERMSIPVDEAMRQVAQLIADAPPVDESEGALPAPGGSQPVSVSLA